MKLDQIKPEKFTMPKKDKLPKPAQALTAPVVEDSTQIPEPGNTIRTKRSDIDGKVERVTDNEVFFRLADGRLMKTELNNVIVVEKLADEDDEVMEEEELDEVSTELLAKYKTAAGKAATAADEKGDFKTGNKRFKGIVKATNKQFDNDAKKSKTTEGSMGGINRSAPATDVSYQDILNDVTDKWKGSTVTVKEHGPYTHKLDTLLGELSEAGNFTDILNKQYKDDQAAKPKPKSVDIPFRGWTIRYKEISPGKVAWIVLDKKNEIKHKGEAISDKEAVGAAEDWISSGAGGTSVAVKSVTIDFNSPFLHQFLPDGDTIYAKFGYNGTAPVLYLSHNPGPGFKKSHTSPGRPAPVVTLSAAEANNARLLMRGRYRIGDKVSAGNDITVYNLEFINYSQGAADKERMPDPGLTVSSS